MIAPEKQLQPQAINNAYNQYKQGNDSKRQVTFAESSFMGFLSAAAPTQIGSGYGIECVNALPKGNGLEKSFEFQQVGQHLDNDIDVNDYRGLAVSQVNLDLEDGKSFYSKKTFEDRDLFKILKNKTTGQTLFYTINDEGNWILNNPFGDSWKDKDPLYSPLGKNVDIEYTFPAINEKLAPIPSSVIGLDVTSNIAFVDLIILGTNLPITGTIKSGEFIPSFGAVIPIGATITGKHRLILKSLNVDNAGVTHKTPYLRNGNASTIYDFKGEEFTYIVWNDSLYLCSGQEYFAGSHGFGSIMKYNRLTGWDSVLTGKAGLFGDSTYLNRTAISTNSNSTNKYIDDNYRSYDSDKDFNPRYIALFKNRGYIGGADAHPLQIKQSERNNIENYVDNTLGIQQPILTSSDGDRASSLIIDSGYNKITALTVYNDKLYIGTDKGWWIYSPENVTLANGQPFSAYSIQENNFTGAGPIRQYATLNFRNQLYYIADYQAIPEIAYFSTQVSAKVTSTQYISVYNKISDPIDTFMAKLDFSQACIGQFQEYTLVSCQEKICGNCEIPKKYTIVFSQFQREGGSVTAFSVIDYIFPTNFLTTKNGCYFTNSENGNLYKIVPNFYSNPENTRHDSVWQSYWTGFNPRTDTALSIKQLQQVKVSGYFSQDAVLELEIIPKFTHKNLNKVGENTNKKHLYKFELTKKDTVDKSLYEDINSRYLAPYYDILLNLPKVSLKSIEYETFSYRLTIKNATYWYLESLVFQGESGKINPESIYEFTPINN